MNLGCINQVLRMRVTQIRDCRWKTPSGGYKGIQSTEREDHNTAACYAFSSSTGVKSWCNFGEFYWVLLHQFKWCKHHKSWVHRSTAHTQGLQWTDFSLNCNVLLDCQLKSPFCPSTCTAKYAETPLNLWVKLKLMKSLLPSHVHVFKCV